MIVNAKCPHICEHLTIAILDWLFNFMIYSYTMFALPGV